MATTRLSPLGPALDDPRRAPLPLLAACLALAAACADVPGAGDARATDLQFVLVEGAADAGTRSSPSASWADFDADGDEDLLVLNGYATLAPDTPQPDVLYRNDGGTLTPVPRHPLVREAAFSGSAVWADYDNDGDVDVFVANQRGADNTLFRNDGGTFVAVAGPPGSDGGRSFSAAWVDVDRDGWLDLHVLNGRDGDGGERDFLYRNVEGRFERVATGPGLHEALPSGGAAWADYDADGDPDLFLPVQSGEMPSRLYRNDGDWRFTEVAAAVGLGTEPLPYSPASSSARWVDYDADGDLDLFVGTAGTFDFLYRNDAGRFERVTAGRVGLDATYVSDALWADLDNDGDLDLAIAVWGGGSEIYRNDHGRLSPAEAGDFGDRVNFASSISPADWDRDGDLDLYLTQWPVNEAGGMPNELYRNDGARGHWLVVELEGRASNRSAIGATITVRTSADGVLLRQLRHVSSRTSWRSAGTLARHFGLGGAAHVDEIQVAWPSGRVDTIPGPIPADRRLRVVEGRPLAP